MCAFVRELFPFINRRKESHFSDPGVLHFAMSIRVLRNTYRRFRHDKAFKNDVDESSYIFRYSRYASSGEGGTHKLAYT